jgi:hypothetical protein
MSDQSFVASSPQFWWGDQSTSQENTEVMPHKSIRWSDTWDHATEEFPAFGVDSQTTDESPDVIALDGSLNRATSSVVRSESLGEYLAISPCSSEDTTVSDNGTSASGDSSPIHSGGGSPPMESGWETSSHSLQSTSAPSAANITPPEILFQIFATLSPRDFDNARHTCSQWMRASLNEPLLKAMLKRAGWWDAWQRDCQTARPAFGGAESLVWRLSKRFSTECVLSGRKVNVEKTGFLPAGVVDFSQLSRESLPKESPGYSRNIFTGPSPRLMAALRDPAFSRSVKFSVSSCGHYVLVATGCMIYVYHLRNRKPGDSQPNRLSASRQPEEIIRDDDLDILPISSIGCPYEVLSATIDTSTPKFVIAALLRGRIGMICDIKGAPIHPFTDQTSSLLRKASHSTGHLDAEHEQTLNEFRDAIASSATIAEPTTPTGRPPISARTVSTRRTMNRLTRATRKYYHDLCSAEDPPRSVSICPGRRCVAFGCGSGIELHWVDEKTQEDTRKLFPMSQPAEVLHFLPSRSEIDETSKLRLISSLAGPGASGCQCHRSANGEDVACQFHLSTGVNSFTHWTPRKNGRLSLVRATHCHHYRAMPINDGLHIVFIEPVSGLLCIGSDAPIGGPTNLTRALICVPPFGNNLTDGWKEERVPTVFAVGSDLSWGLRIVAAYQDRIVLYTVPVDVFNVLRRERERQGENVMGDSDLARDWFLDNERNSQRRGSLAQNQNGDWEFLLRVSYRPTAMMWPLKIYGKEIGRLERAVEFSIQTSHGGVRVWAFGASGEARIFDIDTCTSASRSAMDTGVKSLTMDSDGNIGLAALVDRSESGLLSPLPIRATRKRKQLSQPAPFDRNMFSMAPPPPPLPSTQSAAHSSSPNSSSSRVVSHVPGTTRSESNNKRRQSFAACIMDLKIPELGAREGRWMDPGRTSTATTTTTTSGGTDSVEFDDVASYDPHDLRKVLWSTSSANLSPLRGSPVSRWH